MCNRGNRRESCLRVLKERVSNEDGSYDLARSWLPGKKRVLVALPSRAVDQKKAKMLSRAQSSLMARQCLVCPLLRVIQPVALDIIVLEFDFPKGKPLTELNELEHVSEDVARALCRDLLNTSLGLSTVSLTLRGLLDCSMVYVDQTCRLSGLIPLGSILSQNGVDRAIMSVISTNRMEQLAPDLLQLAALGDRPRHDDFDACSGWDTFAVAAIALQALLSISPSAVDKACKALSHPAGDFLCKTLHWDPQWRLCGEDALSHPWLA